MVLFVRLAAGNLINKKHMPGDECLQNAQVCYVFLAMFSYN